MSESLWLVGCATCTATVSEPSSIDYQTVSSLSKTFTRNKPSEEIQEQILEANLNASFDIYQSSNSDVHEVSGKGTSLVEEISSGKAEYCLNFLLLPPGATWSTQVQTIPSGFSLDMVFVVPMPKRIESWRLFQYIFQCL